MVQSHCVTQYDLSWYYYGRNVLQEIRMTRRVFRLYLTNKCKMCSNRRSFHIGKRNSRFHIHLKPIVFLAGIISFIFLLDSHMFPIFDLNNLLCNNIPNKTRTLEVDSGSYNDEKKIHVQLYSRLLDLAFKSLTKKVNKTSSNKLWREPDPRVSRWIPCAIKRTHSKKEMSQITNGFILLSANGGLNQQRVAICNVVALASLLNSTLVLPKFLYSNVWKDLSQFSDIYQEDHFVNILKDDIDIVKELPSFFKALDIKAIGSLITDADIGKESKPIEYINNILPILLQNRVVHFLGFGNRLGFDPVPYKLQKLRCKCNFHALKFVPKIQRAGSLLLRRIRKQNNAQRMLDKELLGNFIGLSGHKGNDAIWNPLKYVALHLRFEVDMVAYSLCDFGGGDAEFRELQSYRENHFPLLIQRLKNSKLIPPWKLRRLGRCPLTPEEAALVLAGLGLERDTYIYLAGSDIYGGELRMRPFSTLYPNFVTKEDLLTPTELAPFRNFSSQMAALDFIACGSADVFAMTDSGSQLSSLVSGFRIYFGGGHAPTLRPNKKTLAAILSQNATIHWTKFQQNIRQMIWEDQNLHTRSFGQSIYRQPRCPQCMCSSY